MKQLPNNIEEVLEALDEIIDETKQDNNYLGLFAFVYRRVTLAILQAIKEQQFDDNERMNRFDTDFANYYIHAYREYQQQKPISKAWKVAFDARHDKLSFVQHILLGINAHINLDLGVTAANISEGSDIHLLKKDFMIVNGILASLTNEIQHKLGKVSPGMFLLDWFGNKSDERIINFSIEKARDFSWELAKSLSALEGKAKTNKIAEVDTSVAELGKLFKAPPLPLLRFLLYIIRLFETKNIKKVLAKLEA